MEGTLSPDDLAFLVDIVRDLAVNDLPELWCGFAGAFRIITGPDTGAADGRILVRPGPEPGWTGTLGPLSTRSGTVTLALFKRPGTRHSTQSVRSALLHEFFHVAFAFHQCGGPVGLNPFGVSPGNCPFPDSVMANGGVLVPALSPEDRLAACIVYDPETTPGNLLPDTNR